MPALLPSQSVAALNPDESGYGPGDNLADDNPQPSAVS